MKYLMTVAAGVAAILPSVVLAGANRTPAGISAQALFARASSRITHVGRLEVHGAIDSIRNRPPHQVTVANAYDLRFIAPNRMSLIQYYLHTVQVGTHVCSRFEVGGVSPTWSCAQIHTAPNVADQLRTFWPRQALSGASFHSKTVTARDGSKQVKAVAVEMKNTYSAPSGTYKISFTGTLTVEASNSLPLTFQGQLSAHRNPFLRESITFAYSGRFSITLPKGKSASPVPSPPPKP